MELLQRQIIYTDNMQSLQEQESLGPRIQRHLFIHHHALRTGQQHDPESSCSLSHCEWDFETPWCDKLSFQSPPLVPQRWLYFSYHEHTPYLYAI